MKKLSLIQKIKLINKISKAFKTSKKLIENKQGLAKETQDAIIELRMAAQKLVELLPDYKDVYLEIEEIIKNAF